MQPLPRKRSESGPFGEIWKAFNELVDYQRSSAPTNGRGIRITRSMNGAVFSADEVPPVQDSGPVAVKRYLVISVQNDYLVCREMEGASPTGPSINVAKPYDLRRTGWDGVTVTYTIAPYPGAPATRAIGYAYDSPILRRANITIGASSSTEYQEIIPYYVPNRSQIFALEPENDTGVASVTWQDLNTDGRAWAKAI